MYFRGSTLSCVRSEICACMHHLVTSEAAVKRVEGGMIARISSTRRAWAVSSSKAVQWRNQECGRFRVEAHSIGIKASGPYQLYQFSLRTGCTFCYLGAFRGRLSFARVNTEHKSCSPHRIAGPAGCDGTRALRQGESGSDIPEVLNLEEHFHESAEKS
jgi:hypothetical protein